MRYDVFLVSALKDQEQAEMIVRRLRALKFKVRYDKKREHTTPTPKDYRDADNSQSVLVLWSKAACSTRSKDSDWVHAIAHHARSKASVLVQSGLDKVIPDEPFSDDKRYALTGLTSRKMVDGYYDLITDLGKRDGRKNLRQWLDFKAGDKEAKDAWKTKHPTDPLALVGKPKPVATQKAETSIKTTGSVTAPSAPRPVEAKPAPTPIKALQSTPPTGYEEEGIGRDIGQWMIIGVLAGITAMMFLGWLMKTQAGTPAVGNAIVMTAECPAGKMPAYLLNNALEPGPITDDTTVE